MKHVFFIAVMLLVLGRNAYADSQAVVGFWASNNLDF